MHDKSIERRNWLACATGLILAGRIPATSAQTKRRLTPAQTEGPYYPLIEPKDADFDLLRNGDRTYRKGSPAWIEGIVTDPDGKPLSEGVVEIWQCDEQGHYDHPQDGLKMDPSFQGFGRVSLDANGLFRFRTIRPAAYVGRTPHVHAKFYHRGRAVLTTQFYVEGNAGNARDSIWRSMSAEDRALVTAPFLPDADGLRAKYSVTVPV